MTRPPAEGACGGPNVKLQTSNAQHQNGRAVTAHASHYTIGSPMVIVLGALVRVPALLRTEVRTFTAWPAVNGPNAFPLTTSGAVFAKSVSVPTTIHCTCIDGARLPPRGTKVTSTCRPLSPPCVKRSIAMGFGAAAPGS